MATRLWPTDTAPGISPALDAVWDNSGLLQRRLLGPSSADYVFGTSVLSSGSGVANEDTALYQFIYGPLAAQTFSGTLKGQFFCREANAAADARVQIVARVLSSDGSTVRGTLYGPDTAALSSEFAVQTDGSLATNRNIPRGGAQSVAGIAAQAGDYLVVEVGFRNHGTNTGAVRVSAGADEATATTDAPEDETTTVSGIYRSWLEFSHDITINTPLTAEDGAGTDDLAISNQFEVEAETGLGTDDLAISNQFEVEAETGLGTDDLTVSQELAAALDQETGTGTDNLLIEAFTSLSTGRLVIGRFMTEEPGYTIADEIISHEQIDEGRMRPNIVMVDGEDDSWTEYDRADLLQRDTPVNAYLDLPELKSVGSVRQRAVEEQAAAQRSNSPGGEIVWDTHLNRLDRIYWVTENGIKYETRIEGLEVEFNQSMTPFQRASIDTGVVVLCPPEEEDTYLVRDLFERETTDGIGDADTGGTWETY
jgi:hypothetical protein